MDQATAVETRATRDDLARSDDKADLIGGRVVPQMPTGDLPSRTASRIFQSLDAHAEAIARGFALNDSLGFAVREHDSGRQSFSPGAGCHAGPPPANLMDFIAGAPTFAVEVSREGDYGPAAEAEQASKRADDCEAGTPVVWDVAPVAEAIQSDRATDAARPPTYRRGDVADAEPAVPGWRVAVDRIFG